MGTPLTLDRDAIVALCHEYGVKRLAVFGSAVTEDFDPDRSDVDFLVEFLDGLSSKFDAYFDLKEALERLSGRSVDLVMPKALENPYIAQAVRRTAEELYAAA